MTRALVFAAAFAALYAGHMVGDHWPSTHTGAMRKGLTKDQALAAGLHRHAGPRACAVHVATYTATAALFLAAAAWRTGLPLDPRRTGLALAVSALSHYWADRRRTLRWLCRTLDRFFPALCKEAFYDLGAPRPGRDDNPTLGTGAYALDQSFHVLFLFIAALVIA
jgi:hypothetical protein